MKNQLVNALAGVALVTALGVSTDAEAACTSNCPGTPPPTTPTVPTTQVDTRNTIGVTVNPQVNGTNTLNGQVNGTNTLTVAPGGIQGGKADANAQVNLAPGAVQGGTLNVAPGAVQGGNLTLGAGSLSPEQRQAQEQQQRQGQTQQAISGSKIGDIAPQQSTNINFEGTKMQKNPVHSAIAPTLFTGNNNGGAGVYDPNNPFASCFRQASGESAWTGAVTVMVFSAALGKSVPMVEDKECIERVKGYIADNRLAASGKPGQAAVIRRDLDDPTNQALAVAAVANRKMYVECASAAENATDYLLTGICRPEPVSEKVSTFRDAATATPVAAAPVVPAVPNTCPIGTFYAGKAPAWNAKLGRNTCDGPQ